MKYILPSALMLFSIAVLATGLKKESRQDEIAQEKQDVRSTIVVGKKR